jgi:hypothetical protein
VIRTRCPLVILAAMVAHAVPSGAQEGRTDSACTYERCAVWIERGMLRRGASGAVVRRDGFFRPMRLADFVGGTDSAAAWAERFDSRMRAGTTLSKVGMLSFAIGAAAYYVRTRNLGPGEIDDANGLEGALAFLGVIALGGGHIVRTTAEPARNRAIWWYNRRFARP